MNKILSRGLVVAAITSLSLPAFATETKADAAGVNDAAVNECIEQAEEENISQKDIDVYVKECLEDLASERPIDQKPAVGDGA